MLAAKLDLTQVSLKYILTLPRYYACCKTQSSLAITQKTFDHG